ncbi:unnamed protein product [Closterium sp. NIES-53]
MDCPTFVRCRFCGSKFANTQVLGRHLAGNSECYEGHYSAPAPARFDRHGGVVFYIPCRGRGSPVGCATDENGGSTSPNVLPSVNRGSEEMDGGGTEEMESERTEEMESERTEESEGAGSDGEGTPSPSMVADISCSSGIVESDEGATPPGPRVNWHPALLKLLEFLDTANGGMSLSKMDKGKLIQLLLVPELAHVLVAENMRTCRDLERLQLEYIAGTGRGFLTTTFVIEGYPPQVLYHRDIMRELARMFGHQHNAKDFRFRPKVVVDGETKERVYTTAETGTWWNEAQGKSPARFPGRVAASHAAFAMWTRRTCHLSTSRTICARRSCNNRFEINPYQCALWMWTVKGTLWGNPYLAVMPDIMHQADLGLLDHIVRSIRMLIPASLPTLDQRLKDLKGETRISSMRLPSNEYFVSGAQTAAFEHRAVMQILIFLVADKLGASQLDAIRAYLTWYLA